MHIDWILNVNVFGNKEHFLISQYITTNTHYVLPGASTGDAPHDKVMRKSLKGKAGSGLEGLPDPTHDKVMRKSLTEQGGSGLKGSSARASTPKPKSVCLLSAILHSSDIKQGYPRPPFSEENNLEL